MIILDSYLLQVNHVAKSVNIHDTGYRVNGSTHVSQFITNTWSCNQVGPNDAAYVVTLIFTQVKICCVTNLHGLLFAV